MLLGDSVVLLRVVSGGVSKSRASDGYSSDGIIEGKLSRALEGLSKVCSAFRVWLQPDPSGSSEE